MSQFTHTDRKLFHSCLLKAHTQETLSQLLSFDFDKKLAVVAGSSKNFGDTVFNLIEVAEREGWIVKLVLSAYEANPDNRNLAQFSQKFLKKESKPPTSDKHYIIDRMTASDLFEQLMAQRLPQRILWLEGREKMGKSHLLVHFRRQCEIATVAHIRLESNVQDISDVLNEIERQLGEERFAHYAEVVQRHIVASYTDSHDKIMERAEFITARPDPALVKMRRSELTKELVKDLRTIAQTHTRPITILFDALDQAPAQIQNWLQSDFFGRLSRIEGLCIVVACRNAPQPSADWEDAHHHHVLGAVEVKDFRDYCQHKQIELGAETIRTLHTIFEGTPGRFVEAVEKVATSGSGGYA